MTSEERDQIVATLHAIRKDAEADAAKPVPFTPFGIGSVHGELLAMIDALAGICGWILEALPIDNDPDGAIEAEIYEDVMGYDAYGSS